MVREIEHENSIDSKSSKDTDTHTDIDSDSDKGHRQMQVMMGTCIDGGGMHASDLRRVSTIHP